MYISFENFIEEVWDYVSEFVVSDDDWDNNQKFIRELTYEYFKQYNKGLMKTEQNVIVETITPKMCGKMLEATFATMKKNNMI